MKNLLLILTIKVLSFQASASYQGNIRFSLTEIDQHKESIHELLAVSKSCLERHEREHVEFYSKNCIIARNGKKTCLSLFYGDRRYSKSRNQRRSDGRALEYLPDALRSAGFDPALAQIMRSTSCVGLALQCLSEGFSATEQTEQWNKIMSFVRLNNVGGTSLQHALQQLGWKVHYWNPSPMDELVNNALRWDEEEKRWQSKGWHHYRYLTVRNHGTYWHNKVDNKWDLVGFNRSVPRKLASFPFWIGTAHTGYHVFPGTFGRVIEAHSTRHLTSIDNLEFSDFNPLANGGGPRWSATEKYRSGLIALPPI
jgi:hypothetical protein